MIASAETQAAHRQRLERENSESNIYNSKCGIYSAFIIAIVGIGGGCVIVYAGKDSEHGAVACATAGAAIAGVTLVGLVAAFLKGTNSRREERESKSEMMTQALKNKRS